MQKQFSCNTIAKKGSGMKKRSILIIDLEYYINNANTLIINRISKLLSKSFNVTISTYNPLNTRKMESEGDIKIEVVPYYSLNAAMNSGKRHIGDIVKLMWFALKAKNQKNGIEEKNAVYFAKLIQNQVNIGSYDMIISFSNPFTSHYSANILARRYRIPWIAYYFDPFFSNATLNSNYVDIRKEREEQIITVANKILMTYPTNVDYITRAISFNERIIKAEMPGIRRDLYCIDKKQDRNIYKCYYIGNLYSDIRNPENVISFFASLENVADLFFVGGFYGKEINIDLLPNNIHFLGVKSGEDLKTIYNNADFFVNIGNMVTNQMPSKVFEYISTGKPIINFYKNIECPTLLYTKKYDLALDINESEIKSNIEKTKLIFLSFCRNHIGKRISVERINQLFWINTDNAVTDVLANTIMELIGE